MSRGHNKEPEHKSYAETGKVAGTSASTTKEFAKGGFVSTNDQAHKHNGAHMHYKKTKKMGCDGP